MIGAVAANGYAGTTVTDVIKRAAVSRATFYEHFSGKEDCFLAAYDGLIESLLETTTSAIAGDDPWPQRARKALAALLANLAENPDGARVALQEALGAGPKAHARFRRGMQLFVPLVEEGRELSPRGAEIPPRVAQIIVGGVAATIMDDISARKTPDLPGLLPELVYNVLSPIVGHEIAWEEMQRE